MKNLSPRSILSLTLLAASLTAFSAAANDEKPCKEIRAACESAGFTKGGHKAGKGLFKDCLQKISAGETVAGVNVTPDQVSACKAKKEKRAAGKAAKHGA